MTATSTIAPAHHAPGLLGQTVVVIGGSAGIGLETVRRAREEGADVILTARDTDRLHRVGLEFGAASIAAFDATDFDQLRTGGSDRRIRTAGLDRPVGAVGQPQSRQAVRGLWA